MINKKEFDELFKKSEYLTIKNQYDIKNKCCRYNQDNIINFTLEMKDFKNYKKLQKITKIMIYFAVYDTITNEYLDYETFGWKNFNEQIIISKNSSLFQTISKYINFNSNLSFLYMCFPTMFILSTIM